MLRVLLYQECVSRHCPNNTPPHLSCRIVSNRLTDGARNKELIAALRTKEKTRRKEKEGNKTSYGGEQ
jgi:hypothetical protein